MKNYFVLVAIAAIFCGAKGGLLDDEAKILTDFKQKYNNSQSDIIFLMDVSGSVSNYGFTSEKMFVENMLNEFSVAPYSTRVAVITFGAQVKTDINYIDIDPTSTTHQFSTCRSERIYGSFSAQTFATCGSLLAQYATSSLPCWFVIASFHEYRIKSRKTLARRP